MGIGKLNNSVVMTLLDAVTAIWQALLAFGCLQTCVHPFAQLCSCAGRSLAEMHALVSVRACLGLCEAASVSERVGGRGVQSRFRKPPLPLSISDASRYRLLGNANNSKTAPGPAWVKNNEMPASLRTFVHEFPIWT